jgi:hypothetical protein
VSEPHGVPIRGEDAPPSLATRFGADHCRAIIRAVRVTIGKLLAATLLTLCVGVQALEATGRWDRTFQDTGDEAVIVTVVLCVGTALLAAAAIRRRLAPAATSSAIVPLSTRSRPVPILATASPSRNSSPPLSLRI